MIAAPTLDRNHNLFGFLRLAFAFMVIVSHSPELIDGNRSREPLTLLFHTMSLGEVGVAGFFLISGFLIIKSYNESASWSGYLAKRVLRIVPGFVVAFLVSWLIEGPLAGGHVGSDGYAIQLIRMTALESPELGDAFVGQHYTLLNGPMFTIAYEFRCYLLVILLGALAVLRSPRVYLCLMTAIAILFMADFEYGVVPLINRFTGILNVDVKFFMIFLIGGAFYLFRDNIQYNRRHLIIAAVALFVLMFTTWNVAELAVAIFGGYLMFWFALRGSLPWLSRIGRNVDISYGLYLYAWPVQNLIVQRWSGISPSLLTVLTAVIAGSLGYVSWILIESPCLRLKPGRSARRRPAAIA